jgi:hypothetical protein
MPIIVIHNHPNTDPRQHLGRIFKQRFGMYCLDAFSFVSPIFCREVSHFPIFKIQSTSTAFLSEFDDTATKVKVGKVGKVSHH